MKQYAPAYLSLMASQMARVLPLRQTPVLLSLALATLLSETHIAEKSVRTSQSLRPNEQSQLKG